MGSWALPFYGRVKIGCPEGYAIKLMMFEVAPIEWNLTAGATHHIGLAKGMKSQVPGSVQQIVEDGDIICLTSFIGKYISASTSGRGVHFNPGTERIHLEEYDYRFVLDPRVLAWANGVMNNYFAAVYYKFVPCSAGERNAILAWQGANEEAY